MGEEACGGCGSWEDQIYWTHFRYTRFYQFLHPGYDQHLALPDKFSKHLKAKLPGTVSLKGPSGTTWRVELTKVGDTMFFGHGWEEFVKDHTLQEKDLLVFKYNGDSCFEVLIFDGHSFCERPASYFVRKCSNREQEGGSQTKRNSWESCFEFSLDSEEDVDKDPLLDKMVDNEVDKSPIGRPPISLQANKKSRSENGAMKSFHASWSGRTVDSSDQNDGIETKPVIGRSLFTPVLLPSASPTTTTGRMITKEEKYSALHLAQSAVSFKGFAIAMKQSHVRGKLYLGVPSGWITRNLGSLESQDVILRVEDRTWLAKLSFQKSVNRAGLVGGWRNFVVDNNLQEFDACGFEPGTPENGTIVLNVHIFRPSAQGTE